jgi:hypothetical protein
MPRSKDKGKNVNCRSVLTSLAKFVWAHRSTHRNCNCFLFRLYSLFWAVSYDLQYCTKTAVRERVNPFLARRPFTLQYYAVHILLSLQSALSITRQYNIGYCQELYEAGKFKTSGSLVKRGGHITYWIRDIF